MTKIIKDTRIAIRELLGDNYIVYNKSGEYGWRIGERNKLIIGYFEEFDYGVYLELFDHTPELIQKLEQSNIFTEIKLTTIKDRNAIIKAYSSGYLVRGD